MSPRATSTSTNSLEGNDEPEETISPEVLKIFFEKLQEELLAHNEGIMKNLREV